MAAALLVVGNAAAVFDNSETDRLFKDARSLLPPNWPPQPPPQFQAITASPSIPIAPSTTASPIVVALGRDGDTPRYEAKSVPVTVLSGFLGSGKVK